MNGNKAIVKSLKLLTEFHVILLNKRPTGHVTELTLRKQKAEATIFT